MMFSVAQEVAGNAPEDVIFRWATLLTVQGVMFAGIIFGYFSTRNKVRDVSDQATLAAELARPTGNGYAGRSEAALADIKATVIRVEQKVDAHLQDHSSVSLRKRNYE